MEEVKFTNNEHQDSNVQAYLKYSIAKSKKVKQQMVMSIVF